MSKPVYLKLAWQTLKKNYRITIPFVLGGALMEAMEFSVVSMTDNPGLSRIYGFTSAQGFLNMGAVIMIIFAFLFYLYLNSVLMKSRKQEQGLFTVLGMGKGHLVRILFYQYLILAAAIVISGLIMGLLFDKGMYLLAARIFSMKIPMGFHLSFTALKVSVLMTLMILLLLFCLSAFSMLKTNPLDLLKGEKIGEKEIRSRWILALLGILSLGTGYWLALHVKNPVEAITWFFAAVLLVIIGTYLLFLYGFTCLIRLMEKNKNYYYRPSHFISVSTMKYRLKASASSLASIAVLSTTVLVAISASVSLLSGSDALVQAEFPGRVRLAAYHIQNDASGRVEEALKKGLEDSGALEDDSLQIYRFIMTPAMRYEDGIASAETVQQAGSWDDLSGSMLTVIPVDDYNRVTGSDIVLGKGEVYGYFPEITTGEIQIGEYIWKLKEMPEPLKAFGSMDSQVNAYGLPYIFVIANTEDIPALTGLDLVNLQADFDLNAPYTALLEEGLKEWRSRGDSGQAEEYFSPYASVATPLQASVDASLQEAGLGSYYEDDIMNFYGFSFRDEQKADLMGLFGGILFIGIYISVMFAVAVVLIMYYKQISEGAEDAGRFRILQNVGLEPRQIRKIINDQVVLVFFLPLGMAGLHLAFAFPMLQKILAAAGQVNTPLFLSVTLITFAVFVVLYVIAYRLTARTYYKMVRVPESR